MRKFLLPAAVLSFALVSEFHARAAESSAALYKSWNDACLSGGTAEIDAAIAKYEARLARDSKDYLAQAYLGSACALRAKESFWGPTKLSYLKRGQSLLNSAVAAAPKDPQVRMVRAIACYKVPERFGVRPTSIQDFKILVPIAEKPEGPLSTNDRQAILYYAHLAYKEAGMADAAKLKATCHRLDPASHYGKLTK